MRRSDIESRRRGRHVEQRRPHDGEQTDASRATAPISSRPRSDAHRVTLLRLDPVAEAAHGLDEEPPELAPQPGDEHFDGVRVAIERSARRCARSARACDTTRPRWCIRYDSTRNSWLVSFTGAPSTVTRAARGSSTRAPQRSSGVDLSAGAPDQRAQPREHLLHAERLGDVVVGAAVDALDLLVPAAARGQHQHRHAQARRRASAAAPSARRPSAARGRGRPRRSARSGRGSRRARRRRAQSTA